MDDFLFSQFVKKLIKNNIIIELQEIQKEYEKILPDTNVEAEESILLNSIKSLDKYIQTNGLHLKSEQKKKGTTINDMVLLQNLITEYIGIININKSKIDEIVKPIKNIEDWELMLNNNMKAEAEAAERNTTQSGSVRQGNLKQKLGLMVGTVKNVVKKAPVKVAKIVTKVPEKVATLVPKGPVSNIITNGPGKVVRRLDYHEITKNLDEIFKKLDKLNKKCEKIIAKYMIIKDQYESAKLLKLKSAARKMIKLFDKNLKTPKYINAPKEIFFNSPLPNKSKSKKNKSKKSGLSATPHLPPPTPNISFKETAMKAMSQMREAAGNFLNGPNTFKPAKNNTKKKPVPKRQRRTRKAMITDISTPIIANTEKDTKLPPKRVLKSSDGFTIELGNLAKSASSSSSIKTSKNNSKTIARSGSPKATRKYKTKRIARSGSPKATRKYKTKRRARSASPKITSKNNLKYNSFAL
tara:strand:+ start:136 stop:1539 length:1404 start_codon:yes stop_codon:yes gene_type:complete